MVTRLKKEHVMKKEEKNLEEAVNEELIEETASENTEEESEELSEEEVELVEETEADETDPLLLKTKEAEENFNKWQRTLAEFDNFRKRTIKEKTQMYENGAREVVEKLLPVLDNFERALCHISEDEKDSSLAQGVEMIFKQLLNTFSDLGIEEIAALGEEFDPNLHHAVQHEENEDYGENEVIEVLQKGFIYKERVIRHSMVRVAN